MNAVLSGDPSDTIASLKQKIKQINKVEVSFLPILLIRRSSDMMDQPSDQRLVQIDDRNVLDDDKVEAGPWNMFQITLAADVERVQGGRHVNAGVDIAKERRGLASFEERDSS